MLCIDISFTMFSFSTTSLESDSFFLFFFGGGGCRLNFLSINRFERKKNIDLAISAFAMLHTLEGDVLQNNNLDDASLTIAGKSLTLL
jgi:glycosyltransferase involved in cell wall biosynthesis